MWELARWLNIKRVVAASRLRRSVAKGNAARDSRDWVVASTHYQDALMKGPQRADLWVQYGHALKESGRREDAEQAYRQALSINPEEADTYLQLGHVLKLLRRQDEAARAYL